MKSGGQIPWNAVNYLQNVQNLLTDVKSQYELRFKGPIVLFDALVGYLPNSERDKARILQCERNCYEKFYWLCCIRGEKFGRKILWLLLLKNWKILASSNLFQKTECERSPDNPKIWRICISCGRCFSKIIRERPRIPRTHSETGNHRKERESQRRISWR